MQAAPAVEIKVDDRDRRGGHRFVMARHKTDKSLQRRIVSDEHNAFVGIRKTGNDLAQRSALAS